MFLHKRKNKLVVSLVLPTYASQNVVCRSLKSYGLDVCICHRIYCVELVYPNYSRYEGSSTSVVFYK